jgi:hypothetical protein
MKLRDAARVVRSKNAGPTLLTIDILAADEAHFRSIAESPALAPDSLTQRLGLPPGTCTVTRMDLALAVKLTVGRPIVAGSPGDRDVYGAQQHRALLDIDL